MRQHPEIPARFIPGFPPGVRAVMSSRGVQDTPWGFNLATHTGEPPDAVAIRRAALEAEWGIRIQWLQQVHGSHVQVLPAAQATPQADASTTRSPGLACAVMVADCLPVLMALESGQAVAAAHAGWRGLAAGVLEASLESLVGNLGRQTVVAWLGPCIGAGDFEVGPEVLDAFGGPRGPLAQHFRPSPHRSGHFLADLQGLAMSTMERWAFVHECRIRWAAPPGGCTIREASTWFSYRREGTTGRMAGLIWREIQ